MWTQETTKTGHVASFQSDCGTSYVYATLFDFPEKFNVVQHTISPINYYQSEIQTFYEDWETSCSAVRQSAERLANPEDSLQDWPDFAFNY